jgi:aspartate-semialdehyde dehydrogenase
MRLGIIGVTGLVGQTFLEVLSERSLHFADVNFYASARSAGKAVTFNGKSHTVVAYSDACIDQNDIFLVSAGGEFSRMLGPKILAAGKIMIDNSSAWRMHEDIPLVVPEVNGHVLSSAPGIIANPNCSTIQLVVTLFPLREYGLKRVVVSTYQSVGGSGFKGTRQLAAELAQRQSENPVYPHPIADNCLPHIDRFMENGSTGEEMKMVNETKKIMGMDIPLSVTCVRVPVFNSHSESVNVEFKEAFDHLDDIRRLWTAMPGLQVIDDPASNAYPLARDAAGSDEVFVGRLRRDATLASGINYWVVADNLRKGAATNAVQILQYMMKEQLV